MYFVTDIDEADQPLVDQPQNNTSDGDEAGNMDDLVIQELLERSFNEDPVEQNVGPSGVPTITSKLINVWPYTLVLRWFTHRRNSVLDCRLRGRRLVATVKAYPHFWVS